MDGFKVAHADTINVYKRNAEAWDRQRPKVLFEKKWLDRFLATLPESSSILDVGCGAGDPIAAYLIQRGYCVTGLDAAAEMLTLFRSKYPDQDTILMDMRQLELASRYDGIIAWDSFFHLNQQEQRRVLERFIDRLNEGGTMLLTVGDRQGEVMGKVNGEDVYNASLDPEEYRQILKQSGFAQVEVVLEDPECAHHSVVLASQYEEPQKGKR